MLENLLPWSDLPGPALLVGGAVIVLLALWAVQALYDGPVHDEAEVDDALLDRRRAPLGSLGHEALGWQDVVGQALALLIVLIGIPVYALFLFNARSAAELPLRDGSTLVGDSRSYPWDAGESRGFAANWLSRLDALLPGDQSALLSWPVLPLVFGLLVAAVLFVSWVQVGIDRRFEARSGRCHHCRGRGTVSRDDDDVGGYRWRTLGRRRRICPYCDGTGRGQVEA